MEVNLVCWIDALDNGVNVAPNGIPTLTDDYNSWPGLNQDQRFEKSVAFAQAALKARLIKAHEAVRTLRYVRGRLV